MKPFKVLSIDFDFFQKVNKETITQCYPDGHDFSSFLSSVIWAGRYASHKEKLRKVTINKGKFFQIQDIIRRMSYFSPVMVTNSHKHCYEFIKDNYDTEKYQGIELVNIDFHHDMFNEQFEKGNLNTLDCGNWIGHLYNDFPCQITWICNKLSKELYDINNDNFACVREDFSEIDDVEFDAVFLCRSDIWTPPHLDSYFAELFEYICENFENVKYDIQIKEPRNPQLDLQLDFAV